MKRTATRLAAVAGAAALSISLAACGGGGEEKEAEGTTEAATSEAAATTEATTTEAATTEAATTEAATTEAGAPAAATEADLEPAKQRVVDFVKAAGGGDLDGACGMVYDSSTGTGFSGALLDGCKQGLEGEVDTFASVKDLISVDMLTAELDASGAVSVDFKDSSGNPIPVVKGSDGQMYIDLITMVGQGG